MNPITPRYWSSVVLALAAVAAQAQQVPDAGTILRQQPTPPAAAPAPAPKVAPAPTVPARAQGPVFQLKGFRFTGAVLIPESRLQAYVKVYLNSKVNFAILEIIAQQLTGYYLEQGYLARVIVPEQDVKDGIVAMRIIEGVRGSLDLDNRGQRIDSARATAFIDRRLPQGAPMSITRLDEAIAILNEQPGVEAGTSLKTGAREGDVGVVVSLADKPLLTGTTEINGNGGRASGRMQAQGSLTLNNPTGHFDAATALVNVSEGNTFVRGDYSLAVGASGLRLGVNAAHLDYRIIEDSLKALDLKGTATTYGLAASYPLARTRGLTLSLVGSHDVKELIDQFGAAETGNRRVKVTSLGIGGYVQHQLGRLPAITRFGASVNFGDSDQRDAGALAVDNVTRQSNGSFSKLNYSLSNLADLNARWSYNVALSGQFAGNNLDSTERMSLGGPTALRAYPTGEATGDEGWLVNFNLRRSFGNTVAATFFYDVGGITLNHSTWANWNAGNPNLPNRYTLSGLGAALDWRLTPATLLSAILAVPVGSNPGRDANNLNADGRKNEARVWLSLNAQF
ncbi:MAG: ShlB/FhaC/HecB family hemolysin secretion/activation protein [Sulfuritalea sp.]|nr:ShlB/FhaC/HecB family hemolysin secretion/activation protein [Sulfuritalea sp.]